MTGETESDWRRLALQFDAHRMAALAHLRVLLDAPEVHRAAVQKFLAQPPLDGDAVLRVYLQKLAEAETGGQARLYYEAHVTIEPVPEGDRDRVQLIAAPFQFRLAKFLMQKGEPSKIDSFMTGHGKSITDITERTRQCVFALQAHGILVRRYKIGDTLLDSRHGDSL